MRVLESRGPLEALLSGVFAALSGVSAKLALDPDNTNKVEIYCRLVSDYLQVSSEACIYPEFDYIFRGCFLLILVFLNVLMFRHFNRALQHCKTTIEASIINTAANFILTALLGNAVFEEQLSLSWWLGTVLILSGTLLVATK